MESSEKLCFFCDRAKGLDNFPSMMHNNDSNISNSKSEQLLCADEKCCKEWTVCGSFSEHLDKTKPKVLPEEMKSYSCQDFHSINSIKDFEKVCNERIFQLDQRIGIIRVERKAIQDSSCKLKKEIHDQINGKMNLLRKREFQLYRQVDALYNHQNTLLQEHLSKLHSVLGGYQATLASSSYKDAFECFNVECAKQIFMESPSYEEVMVGFPKQKLQFVVDDMNLKSVIQSYGRVEVSGGHTGMFLLPDEEDYEDGNQVLLSKSLSPEKEQSQEKGSSCCEVHNKRESSALSATSSDVPHLKGAQITHPVRNYVASPLQKTLIDSSCSTDSFEIIMNDVKDVTNEEIVKVRENNSYCTCDDLADKDIESLSELSCASGHSTEKSVVVSEWLRKNEALDRSFLSKVSPSIPHVKRLCKANKKCSSYSACICRVNCLVSHLKEQLERLRLCDTSMFSRRQLNHTINQVIQKETQKNESADNSSNSSRAAEDEKMDVEMLIPLSLNWDTESWLIPREGTKPILEKRETWLANSSSIEDEPDAADLVKRLFAPYLADKNMEQWLQPSFEKYSSQSC